MVSYVQCITDGCNSNLAQPTQCAAAVTADLLTQRNLSFPETATVTSFYLETSCGNCANLGVCPQKPFGSDEPLVARPAAVRLFYDCVDGGATSKGLVLLLDYPEPDMWASGITGGLTVTYCEETWSTLFWVMTSLLGFLGALALCCWKSGIISEHMRHKREDEEREAAKLEAAMNGTKPKKGKMQTPM